MNRRSNGLILFLPLLMCLLGADSIDWAAGSPVGGSGTVSGKGTYSVDPANTFGGVSFTTKQGAVSASIAANAAKGSWDATANVAAGTYDCFATLVTTNAKGNLISTNSSAKTAVALP